MDRIIIEKVNKIGDEPETIVREAVIETDGYLILYLKENKIKATGDIGLKAFAPILTKIALEKIIK